MEEISKRVGEAGAGIAAAGYAVGLQAAKANLDGTRQRVHDGHAAGMRALGMEDLISELGDMGNVVVTGDLYGDKAVQTLRQSLGGQGQSDGATAPQEPGLLRKALPYLLVALLCSLGPAGFILGQYLQKSETTSQDQEYIDTSSEIGIGGGQPTLEW